MTTNQTIDGVPRELLEQALAHILPICASDTIRKELRALLDAEVPERAADRPEFRAPIRVREFGAKSCCGSCPGGCVEGIKA